MGVEIQEVAKDVSALKGECKGVTCVGGGDSCCRIGGGGYCLQPLIEAFLKEGWIHFTRKSSIGKVTLQPEVRAFGMILRCQM